MSSLNEGCRSGPESILISFSLNLFVISLDKTPEIHFPSLLQQFAFCDIYNENLKRKNMQQEENGITLGCVTLESRIDINEDVQFENAMKMMMMLEDSGNGKMKMKIMMIMMNFRVLTLYGPNC